MNWTDRIAKRYKEAFKEGYNVLGLAAAASVSAATLNPLPLLAGLVAEAAYLLFVPDSKWYEKRMSRKYDAEIQQRRAQLRRQVLPNLEPEVRDRFLRLEEMRYRIGEQPMKEELWLQEVLRKLDYLLEKFLMFANKDAQFTVYLDGVLEEVKRESRGNTEHESFAAFRKRRATASRPSQSEPEPEVESADPTDRWVNKTVSKIQAFYETEIERVSLTRTQEKDVNTQAVLERRLDVLKRRQDFFGKLARVLINLNHQMRLLEDTLGLIHDEIYTRPPEQVLADIDDVVSQTDVMTQVLEEVAPYEQLAQRLGEIGG